MHYKPFGDTIETPKDDVGYTGHKFDAELNLSYMQARYFDPEIGRFYGNDPVGSLNFINKGQIQGFGRYTYVNDNPYKYTDPDGKAAWLVIPVVVGFVAGSVKSIAQQAAAGKTIDTMKVLSSGADGALTGAVMAVGGAALGATKLGATMLQLNKAAVSTTAVKTYVGSITGNAAVGGLWGAAERVIEGDSTEAEETKETNSTEEKPKDETTGGTS